MTAVRNPDRVRRAPYLLLLALMALLVAMVLFVYQLAPLNSFHLDDEPNIVDNQAIHTEQLNLTAFADAATHGANHRRILPNMSFVVDWWRGNGSPVPFQQTNIALHAINALLVCIVLFQLLGVARPQTPVRMLAWFAFVGAALWALHPIQVQSVTYIVQRMAAMATLFTLAALACYLRGRTGPGRSWPWFAAAGLSMLLGALSKENAWMAPALLLLAEYGVIRHQSPKLIVRGLDRWLLAMPLVLGVALIVDVLLHGPFFNWAVGGYGGRNFTLAERLWTQPRVIAFHLGQILWPLPGRFSIEHDFTLSTGLFSPLSTWFAFTGLGVWLAGGLTLLFRRGLRIFGFLLLWVPLMLVVESSVIPLEMVFEHRMQLPMVALAALVALALAHLPAGVVRGAVLGLALLAVIGVGWSTMERVPVWRDNLTLYTAALDHASGSQRVQYNVANALREAGRHAEAVDHYRKAIAIGPEKSAVMNNYATSLRALREYREAATVLRQSLQIDPGHINSIVNLGTVLLELGEHAEGDARFGAALQMAPRYTAIYRRYAQTLVATGRIDDARRVLQAGLQQRPDAQVLRNMLEQLPRPGSDLHKALAEFEQLALQRPNDVSVQLMRGAALASVGETGRAIEAFELVLRLDPDNALAHGNLGRAFAGLGERQLAIGHLREALRADPGLSNMRRMLEQLEAE